MYPGRFSGGLWGELELGNILEWVICAVKAIYENAKSCVRLNDQFSDKFNIKVGIHQHAVLSLLLFIIAMEALSREFKVGCPWELLYADDLVLMVETLEALKSGKIISKQKSSVSTSIKQNLYAANTICQSSQIL